jgi:4-amino-4-deoxy-L-arabinose transferase-like glycosyltransferase
MKLGVMVFLAAFAILSWNLWNIGMASGDIDPVMHLGAQDEATYTREAIHMAREGGWMTPTFLGRWVFEKPPLLMWLSAVSMKMFGIGRFPARLPVVFAGALICALCFSMVRRRSLAAGLAAAAMAVSSQILFILSRHSLTDILLAAAGMCAFAILLHDEKPRAGAKTGIETSLDLAALTSGGRAARQATRNDGLPHGGLVESVCATAAGIMAKSVAGLLVLGVMGVVVGFGQRRWGRAMLAGAFSMVLAAPWFLYNFFLHREWFLADMGFQLITIGTAAHQTSPENHLWFYIVRILNSDLIPLVLSVTAIPALVRALRQRDSAALLAASYGVIYFTALMVFRFHSEQYLCWFVPSLILIAGLYSPLLNGKGALIAIAVIAAAFVVKLANPQRSFGISMQPGTTIAAAPVLSRYCTEHRATDLYILGVDDQFYSAVLPLHHVRYGWIDPTDMVAREHAHLAYLGILIPADELAKLDAQLPVYRDRLRGWGLDSTRAIATGISAHDIAGLLRIIHDHPESDFLVARAILPDPQADSSHTVRMAGADFALLEAKSPVKNEEPAWSCEM